MYHYITLGSVVINMTGIGIVLFLATFLLVLHRESKRKGLHFYSFLRYVPLYIIIIYLCGTYTHYLLSQFSLIPLSINQILRYFSPFEYNFSTIGIFLGLLLGGWKFLKQKEKRAAWVSSFLYAAVWGMVPLGLCLLLGDAFIGLPTDGGFFVSAIRSDSLVATYDKVIPLGFYFSLLGVLSGSVLFVFHKTLHPRRGYLGCAILAFLLSILYIFQQYPRRLVTPVGDISIDIKQYFLRIIALGFVFIWWRSKETK